MKKFYFPLAPLAVVLLVACATPVESEPPPMAWIKAGGTQEQRAQDVGQCRAQALATPGMYAPQMLMVFQSCMQGKGWRAVDAATAPRLPSATQIARKAPVIAILADDLFLGDAEGADTGSVAIQSQFDPALHCLGSFRRETPRGGSGKLLCSDGVTFDFQFQSVTAVSGYGVGSSMRGPLTFTWGMSLDESKPYLRLPAGKTIQRNEKGMELKSF